MNDFLPLSGEDKLILLDLLYRPSMSLKSSQDNSTYSYRQFLRKIDRFIAQNVIQGWVPIFHPNILGQKLVWFFLRTNPRGPQDLDYLQSLKGQIISLAGIAGSFSLLALMQFQNDADFNASLANIDRHFSVPNPVFYPLRYQYLEIIAFYKFNGFVTSEKSKELAIFEKDLMNSLNLLGHKSNRPPTVEDIADHLKVSSSTVQKHLKSMESNHTILGYSIILNSYYKPPVKTIVQFNVHPGSYNSVVDLLQEDPHIFLLCKIQIETFNLLAVVYSLSIRDFDIWLKELYKNEGILDTLTSVVLNDDFPVNNPLLFPIL